MMHVFGMGILWLLLPLMLLGPRVGGAARRHRLRLRDDVDEHMGGGTSAGRAGLEAEIYRLAKRLGGRVTVSDAVVATGLPVREAERLLEEVTDGHRVRMEVDARGVVSYEVAEILRDG